MKQKVWEIMAASLLGEEVSPAEKSMLQEWLEESEGNRAEYARLERFCRECGEMGEEGLPDVAEAWRENRQQRAALARQKRVRIWGHWGIAAAVALLLGGAGALLRGGQGEAEIVMPKVAEVVVPGLPRATLTLADGETVDLQEADGQIGKEAQNADNTLEYAAEKGKRAKELVWHLLSIPRGGEYHLKLSDGTEVWVNSDTRLRFPVAFGEGERRVELSGEAYFAVAKDAARPFVVCADGVDVTALGTEFNVSSGGGEEAVFTTLVSGAVRVRNEAGRECVLEPAQQAVCRKDEAAIGVQEVDPALYTSWKDGYYAFRKQPLGEIMRTVARWYDVEVEFVAEELEDVRFSGRLRRYEEVENLLNMIKLTDDVDFEMKERTIVVRKKESRK